MRGELTLVNSLFIISDVNTLLSFFMNHTRLHQIFTSIGIILFTATTTLVPTASAVVLFQDDNFQDVNSSAIRLGANDAGANNTAVQFGNDGTSSENGTITWNIGSNTFSIDHAVNITGGLSTSGGSFSASTGAGTFEATTTTGKLTLTSGMAANNAIDLQANNADGGITANWGSGGLNFSSSTGSFSVSGTGDSTLNATSGALNLTTTTSGDIALTSASDITFDDANLATAIKLNNAQTGLAGTFASGSGILDALNELTLTTAGNGASNVGLEAGSLTNVTPASDDVQAALEALDAQIGSATTHNEDLTFYPEYPNAVLFSDGTNNNGTLSADYDSTNLEHYYEWTTVTVTLQDMDVKFRFPLPADFASTGDFTFRYRTGTTTTADNRVDVTLSNSTDLTGGNPTACGSSTSNATANAWATGTITAATLNAGCTGATALNAGDIIEVDAKLYDVSNVIAPGTFADIGFLKLVYNN